MKAIADQCGVKINTRCNREVNLTSKLPPLVVSVHESYWFTMKMAVSC